MKKIILPIIFLCVLVVSVFGAYEVFYTLYDKYNDTRLNPLERKLLDKDFSKTYKNILLGDSHVQFWKLSPDNSLNLGMTGQTSEQIKLRSTLLKDSLKGENLIISVGANDVKAIATNPENAAEIQIQCLKNLEKIVNQHKENFNKIYVMTIPPDFSASVFQEFFNYKETLQTKDFINHDIRNFCKKNNLKIIDTYLIFTENAKGLDRRLPLNYKEFSEDGVHMNQKGYMLLENEIDLDSK